MSGKLKLLAHRLVVQAQKSCPTCSGKGRYVNCDEYHAHQYDCTVPCGRCLKLAQDLEEALADV